MKRSSFVGVALLMLVSGCSVAGVTARESTVAINECGADDGCPDGQECSRSICIGKSGSLSNLLFDVAPSALAPSLSGMQFFASKSEVGLVPGSAEVKLDDVAVITGSVTAVQCNAEFQDPAEPSSVLAQSSSGSIPVRMTFTPSERVWGLASANIQSTATKLDNNGEYAVKVTLPGGSYDIYVEPLLLTPSALNAAKPCSFSPQLFRAQALKGSTNLKLSVPTAKHIDVQVRFPEGPQTLDQWSVNLLEPVTGRVVSTTATLQLPTRNDGTLTYSFGLDYVPVWGDDPKITHGELLRLLPPEGVDAPSLFFWREGLEWASAGTGVIDQLTALPSAVSYGGKVTDESGAGVAASITFSASVVSGVASGLFPSFIRSVKTDEEGRFKLPLLPGNYKVVVTPNLPIDATERPFAIATSELTILPTPVVQAGTTLLVQPALKVYGTVLTSTGEAARGVVVSAEVSPGLSTSSVFERAIGALPTVPRATTAVVDASGSFELFTEPGAYDFSIKPPAISNFAWLVMPGFEPTATYNEASMPSLDVPLPELRLPAPVPLDLRVKLGSRTDSESASLLTDASVRVYALLDATGAATADAKAAVSAVRVAETRLDGSGRATLMLPAKLDRPPQGFSSDATGNSGP